MRKQLVSVFLAGVVSTLVLIGVVMFVASNITAVDAQSSNEGTWGSTYFSSAVGNVHIEDFEAWLSQVPAECDLVATAQLNFWAHRCPEGVTVPDPR